jgi:hypothetical protein
MHHFHERIALLDSGNRPKFGQKAFQASIAPPFRHTPPNVLLEEVKVFIRVFDWKPVWANYLGENINV